MCLLLVDCLTVGVDCWCCCFVLVLLIRFVVVVFFFGCLSLVLTVFGWFDGWFGRCFTG